MTLEELATNEQIRCEYQRTLLLNIFQKLCVKMEKEEAFDKKMRTLYRQAKEKKAPLSGIVEREFNYSLSNEEAQTMLKWFEAHLNKKPKRKPLPLSLKEELFTKQNGLCVICGEPLDKDWSKIHVDHIIPWKLVGDELEDNYQVLCDTCNECKSARTDYIFKALLNLI